MLRWVYGTVSVLIISLVGLVIVVFLPFLQHDHQSNISQLFVGLAIGTLTSDALLHLLPHAFSSKTTFHPVNETVHEEHGDHHTDSHHHHSHADSVWYGLMALLGMVGFLLFERLVMILRDLAHRHSHNDSNKIKQCAPSAELISPELEKLNHKHHDHEMKEKSVVDVHKVNMINGASDVQVHDECHRSTITFPNPDGEGYMHLGAHHHHHHKAHQGPSAALMVLAGDIVHNLFDGLAIGVAFSGTGISGGLSTSLAVLCHELPHELGDFTIIIRSGMSLRSAIFWNIIASVICWFGMALGILLGAVNDSWLSALIAGTFLYISLVDMVPELDSCPHLPSKNRAIKLTVQLVGITVGVLIMLVISLYEEHMKSLFPVQ